MGIDGSEIRKKAQQNERELQKTRVNLKNCLVCQKLVSKNAESCPHCGEPHMTMTHDKMESIDKYSKITGVSGAALLAIGVFCPVISAPFLGDINLFRNGEGDGVGLLILAVLSVLLIATNKMRFLWYSAAGSLILLGFTFYQIKSKLGSIAEEATADLAGNPFRGIVDVAIQSVQMQWGWGVLIVGCCLLFAAAFYNGKHLAE
jgi:hypothetical protein